MEREQRLELLQQVLEYCTAKGGVFSIGERICINQERGRLMDDEREVEPYPYSKSLQAKIDFTIMKINQQLNTI